MVFCWVNVPVPRSSWVFGVREFFHKMIQWPGSLHDATNVFQPHRPKDLRSVFSGSGMAGAGIVDLPTFFHKKNKSNLGQYTIYILLGYRICLVVFWCLCHSCDMIYNQPPQRRRCCGRKPPRMCLMRTSVECWSLKRWFLALWKLGSLVAVWDQMSCYPSPVCFF